MKRVYKALRKTIAERAENTKFSRLKTTIGSN